MRNPIAPAITNFYLASASPGSSLKKPRLAPKRLNQSGVVQLEPRVIYDRREMSIYCRLLDLSGNLGYHRGIKKAPLLRTNCIEI